MLGLGYGAPAYGSAALSGPLDCARNSRSRFRNNGSVVTPLLSIENRDRVTVTALLEDAQGRAIVAGWRTRPTALDADFPVIVAARYSSSGALDPSFGERGIVTTRIEKDGVASFRGGARPRWPTPRGRLQRRPEERQARGVRRLADSRHPVALHGRRRRARGGTFFCMTPATETAGIAGRLRHAHALPCGPHAQQFVRTVEGDGLANHRRLGNTPISKNQGSSINSSQRSPSRSPTAASSNRSRCRDRPYRWFR